MDLPRQCNGNAFYEPVGELQAQAQQQARQHQMRGLNLAIPAPVENSTIAKQHSTLTPGPDAAARPGLQRDPSSTAGLKRKRNSLGPAGKVAQPRQQSTISDDDSDIEISDESADEHGQPSEGGVHQSGKSPNVTASSAPQHGDRASEPQAISSVEQKVQDMRILAERQNAPLVLPARKVFPIQIGSELFRLSGVSLSSDAPSYFTDFFEAQIRSGTSVDDVRTLYIDRDPDTFRDISLHLQGYHIEPRDGTHFVRLFADAILFSLPRLTQQLYKSTIFIRVGEQEFKVPRDLFNGPGDTPNYFTLGFSIFFTHPKNVFPGLSDSALLRPPSILPPQVTNRSARVFQDILDILKGYDVHIRDEDHRTELLRDARYFHFKGLEQRLVAHRISYNMYRARQEITLRFEDIRPAGISFRDFRKSLRAESSKSRTAEPSELEAVITYARPHIDDDPNDLNIEIGPNIIGMTCSMDSSHNHIVPHPTQRSKFSQLYKTVCHAIEATMPSGTKLDMLHSGVIATLDKTAHVVIDGRTLDWSNVETGGHNDLTQLWIASQGEQMPDEDELKERTKEEWTVLRSIWRIEIKMVRKDDKPKLGVYWHAVKLDAVTGEGAANGRREWL